MDQPIVGAGRCLESSRSPREVRVRPLLHPLSFQVVIRPDEERRWKRRKRAFLLACRCESCRYRLDLRLAGVAPPRSTACADWLDR